MHNSFMQQHLVKFAQWAAEEGVVALYPDAHLLYPVHEVVLSFDLVPYK